MTKYIFKSTGQYLGFISNNYIFSRDGVYLGWVDDKLVWGKDGQFKGVVFELNDYTYVVRNKFTVSPIPKSPRAIPSTPSAPQPAANVAPISLPLGYEDAF